LCQLIEMSKRSVSVPSEPFWPACARFDKIAAPPGQGSIWFMCAAIEQLERASAYSSRFAHAPSPFLEWICSQPFGSKEMERRRMLQAVRAGQPAKPPLHLLTEAPDHLNPSLWRQFDVIAAR
jgi:hypothetical protein